MKKELFATMVAMLFLASPTAAQVVEEEGEVEADIAGEEDGMGAGFEATAEADLEPEPIVDADPVAAEVEPETETETEPISVTPYGLIIFNAWYNTAPLSFSDIPVTALGGDGGSLGMTLRQSRFGLKVNAPPVASAMGADEVSAVLELDFLGGNFANNNVTYTMSHPRMRLYFVKVKLGDVSLVVGQDWVIAAPLSPLSLSHMALPGFHATGNLWARLPQVRVDAGLGPLTVQAGVMAPVSTDSTGAGFTVGRVASASERSKSPTLQARVAFSTDMGDEKLTIGASGHFGLEEVGTVMIDPMTMMEVPTGNTETASSYAAVLDLTVPIAGLFTLQGEAFYGQNLDGLFSRADVNRFDGEAIAAWGGWAQLLLNLDPLTFGVAAGIERFVEDPEARNLALYLAAIYTVAPGFKVGLQLDHIRTNAGMGDDLVGNQINASAHFGF